MSEESTEIRNVKGDVSAATGGSNIVGKEVTIKGDVNYYVIAPTPELMKRLKEISNMPTEVQPGNTAGIEGSKTHEVNQEAQKDKSELMDKLLKALEKHGDQAKEVAAGDLHFSRVELLIKQAVLLKTEADQMLLDHALKSRNRLESGGRPGTTLKIDLNQLFADFDDSARMDKLKEVYALLEEANKLDPTNTEALLHIAQLLIVLTPDDYSDEQRILYRIQNLLNSPKDDIERFRLAQTTFLLATTHKPMLTDSIRDARLMFDKLGRPEWVRQCDDLLASTGYSPVPGMGMPYVQPAPDPWTNVTAGPVQPAAPPAVFQPAGQWHVQITDGTQMSLNLYPNGTFQAIQQGYGLSIQGTGQWAFSPYNNMLQLQGLINGFQPFMLGIIIQSPQGAGYFGVGTDGHGYTMMRV
ncbi:MAG: hypothetical protein HW384_1089 [Dehalococcoidia bacterium]|nr:hypothetical protein [Dehalococcoidia bacterium]